MKITIIIPVHNGEKTLRRCVESFVLQDYADKEIILVENRSTDDTLAVCRQLQAEYACVRCAVSEKKGVSAARNLGLELAGGDIIGFSDADDAAEEGSLQAVREAFDESPERGVVVGTIVVVGQDGQREWRRYETKDVSAGKLLDLSIYNSRIMGSVCNKFFRRALLAGCRFDETLELCEDMHFLAKVLSANRRCRVRILSRPVYRYIYSANSATTDQNNMIDERGLNKYCNACKKVMQDCGVPHKTAMIVRHVIFVHSARTLFGRVPVGPAGERVLKEDMRGGLMSFLLTLWIRPVEALKIVKMGLKYALAERETK